MATTIVAVVSIFVSMHSGSDWERPSLERYVVRNAMQYEPTLERRDQLDESWDFYNDEDEYIEEDSFSFRGLLAFSR